MVPGFQGCMVGILRLNFQSELFLYRANSNRVDSVRGECPSASICRNVL